MPKLMAEITTGESPYGGPSITSRSNIHARLHTWHTFVTVDLQSDGSVRVEVTRDHDTIESVDVPSEENP